MIKNIYQLKKWEKPELLILVRNHPEEMILVVCKEEGSAIDTYMVAGGCAFGDGDDCTQCLDSRGS
jgi:hypothetical protein